MIRALPVLLALVLAVSLGGCKKENCEKLLEIACEHVAKAKDGDDQCAQLRKQAETVKDEDCKKTLRLLKETGKLQNQPR